MGAQAWRNPPGELEPYPKTFWNLERNSAVDRFVEGPEAQGEDEESIGARDGAALKEAALNEARLLVTVLESERDLLVSGNWESLDVILEEKGQRTKAMAELLAGLLPEDFLGKENEVDGPSLRSALLHVEELASVNLAIARESSMIVENVLRELTQESEGGRTYGSGGTVGSGQSSPALVSTRS